ncbi:methyltransferase domain-containing protein [Candidatus Pacearchaeota archaeon]|nr:methyltransferase domain-containing protein [Candidatus Pacearchaeota archaeon]
MYEIYTPAEDSYLLLRVLGDEVPKLIQENPDLKVLEMGSGSGIQLEVLKKMGVKNILAADLNSAAVEHCKKLGFDCIHSDLFEKIKEKFDLIIFNSPYLPRDIREPKSSQLATTGGKKGNEIINEFIKQSKEHLNKGGKIFLLTSSRTAKVDFKGYKKKLLDKEDMFFEQLFLWELKN